MAVIIPCKAFSYRVQQGRVRGMKDNGGIFIEDVIYHQVLRSEEVVASGTNKQAARALLRTLNNIPLPLAEAMLKIIGSAAVYKYEKQLRAREQLPVYNPNERHTIAT